MEEKKISLDQLEELIEESSEGDKSRLNFQTIYAALVLNWQWFLLSLIICFCMALIYLRYAEPVYQVSARMLIKDDNKKRSPAGQMLSGVEDLGFLTNSTGIDNEVEVLKSRMLLRDVVKDLKLYTEYRTQGRIGTSIVYQTQPVNIDLDPQHLDSLDFNLLEKTQWLKMKVWREGKKYMVEGTAMENQVEQQAFIHKADSLPTSFKTALGIITMTKNGSREFEEGKVYLATIRPPMAVATDYLKQLTVAPTSKLTSIAELTLKDKNYRRGMDVLRQLNICYNRQANADKNEVALRTEEFINDRMAKINAELGSTESEITAFDVL